MATEVHKRLITRTLVEPAGRQKYVRTNYNRVVCLTPWSMLPPGDTVTNDDRYVTCPECRKQIKMINDGAGPRPF